MSRILLVFFVAQVIWACNPQKQISGNYTYKSECMGVELDGSQTIRSWGSGRNRWDAIEQAKKNAVRDVLFNGIYNGKSECEKRPVLPEVNAQQKHEDYFNKFFTDDGEYKNYVNVKDERLDDRISRNRKPGDQSVTHGVIVRVLRSDLKNKMIQDGILPK